jgi:hypothetical protein
MDINKLKSQLAAMQEEINRTAEHYGLGGHLQRMLNGGEIHHLPVMPYGFAKQGSYMTNTKVYSPEELKTMKLNQATSIVDAMKLMGDDSSFANRKKMAEEMGIKNYTGSSTQNQELMQKYYASKRQFSDDASSQAPLPPGREAIAPMQSRSAQPIPTSGMQRPIPEAPIIGGESIAGEPYSFDELPNTGAMMMNDRAIGSAIPSQQMSAQGMEYSDQFPEDNSGPMMNDRATGTAMPPDTRVRTLADLPPRETMAPVDLSQRLEKTPIAEMPETRRPAPAKPTSGGAKKPPVKSTAPPAKSSRVYNTLDDRTLTGPLRYSEYVSPMVNNNPYDQFFGGYNAFGEPMGFGVVDPKSDDFNNNQFIMTDRLGPGGGRIVMRKDDDGSLFPVEMYNNNSGDRLSRDYVGATEIKGSRSELRNRSGQGNHPYWVGTSDDSPVVGLEAENKDYEDYKMDRVAALTRPAIDAKFMSKIKKRDGGMNSDQSDMYFAGGEIENDPHIMELYGFQNGGETMQLPVMPYGFAEMGMMTGDEVTGKTAGPAKMMNSQQLAGLATQFFSRDPSMQTPIPNFVGNYQLSDMDKTLMMEAMKQMKGSQGSTGAYPAITPQMIDQIRPRIEQNRTMDQPRTQSMGGMNYEDGGQMPMDIAVARFKAAAKDKGLAGGEAMAYVEKMKSKYNYQKGGAVSEKELGNYEVGMYGTGGIMYNGTKFPGYNKAISTAPGDKFKKQMLLEKGGKIKLVKFGHR